MKNVNIVGIHTNNRHKNKVINLFSQVSKMYRPYYFTTYYYIMSRIC